MPTQTRINIPQLLLQIKNRIWISLKNKHRAREKKEKRGSKGQGKYT